MSNHNRIAPRERLCPVRDLYSNAVAGRAKYKFASFWNRNHAHRALQRAHKNFATMQAVAKQEQQVSSMRTRSGSSRTFDEAAVKIDTSEPSEVPIVIQPFLQEDVLNNVVNVGLNTRPPLDWLCS
jgi:hypothetical protein